VGSESPGLWKSRRCRIGPRFDDINGRQYRGEVRSVPREKEGKADSNLGSQQRADDRMKDLVRLKTLATVLYN